jgi:hypothetical protein
MALKTLLVALTTTREIDGKQQRVRFAAKSVVDLTEAELETLTALQTKTGKLHFRDPQQEGGKATESAPEVVEVDDYLGQKVAIDKKDVPSLKAYLTFHDVEFAGNASKDTLRGLADEYAKKAAADPDAGL